MLHATIHEKTAGAKLLLSGFEIRLNSGEKLGLIGRNGTGKTTLFNILLGVDKDYDGKLDITKSEVVLATLQEHHGFDDVSVLDYITSRLPKFSSLKHIIDTHPETMGENMKLLSEFSDAIAEFSDRGYYDIENEILSLVNNYQLPTDLLSRDFSSLSGGQKRLCDLIAIQIGKPTIALLDEPTNHMDYVAKGVFIDWLRSTNAACVIISHDRDVLENVDRIIELKDRTSYSFPGNYDSYLKQNSTKTVGMMQSFETTEKRIENIKEQIRYAKIKAKSKAGGNTGRSGKNQWVVLQERLEKELAEIMGSHEKPEFWIDKNSVDKLAPKLTEKYDKYKAKNIHVKVNDSDAEGILLDVHDLSLGYNTTPLFKNVSFQLRGHDRLHIKGRNGAGKTTLVRAISDAVNNIRPDTLIGKGTIIPHRALRLSTYHQEVPQSMLPLALEDAVAEIFSEKNLPINDQAIRNTLAAYLFNPELDSKTPVELLSGGQKARLQLIRMLLGKPSLLILDEPTNHLDLPSIEELESALASYDGAIIYISHDSYFVSTMGGKTITIGS
jgi:ATP-binding cassette, subfamily F, member 3